MNLDKYIEILSSSELFEGSSKDSISLLFKSLDYKIENYSKEDIIFFEDDECKCLSIILEGSVEIQKIDSNGKVLTVAKFLAGNIFGELLIFSDSSKFPMTVVSKVNSVILHINKESVVKLCQLETHFLYSYLKIISNKAFILNQKLKEVTLKTIRQQISEFIINQSRRNNNAAIIKINMSKKDWADKIGVQRPSLSRELIKMKEEGIIDYEKDIIKILNMDNLKEYI
jgi:CRP-like cAMP-binding protein